jgi:flavin reductase (DIM6/NTAB) family NADH-FMN oxidoreductase RutF
MAHSRKTDFPLDDVRRHLEPGPVILVSSSYKGETDIMTMGWHMIMEQQPSLVGCFIWDQNYSFNLIRKSRECVINVPTVDMADKVVGIGNCSGAGIDKFALFGLTKKTAQKVKSPLIDECYASFECKLSDSRLIPKYSLFIFKVVKAHVARRPRNPRTMHYRGHGEFMIAGKSLNLRRKFKPEYL